MQLRRSNDQWDPGSLLPGDGVASRCGCSIIVSVIKLGNSKIKIVFVENMRIFSQEIIEHPGGGYDISPARELYEQ